MINIAHYKQQILKLYSQGVKPVDITKQLGLSYHQPVYNILKKEGAFVKRKTVYRTKYSVDKNFFKLIDTEIKAYILGFICADGNVNYNRLRVTVSVKDIDILEKIKEALQSDVPIVSTQRPNPYPTGKPICEMRHIDIASVELMKPLIEAGLNSNKTYSLTSSILKIVPDNLIRHFLRGYFDGDGNVMFGREYDSGKKYSINICGNEEFLLNTFQKYHPSTNKMYYEKKSKQMFVWKISSKQGVVDFLRYIYDDASIYLQRKYNVYLEHAHIKPIKLLES